jgi:hypothetical protein
LEVQRQLLILHLQPVPVDLEAAAEPVLLPEAVVAGIQVVVELIQTQVQPLILGAVVDLGLLQMQPRWLPAMDSMKDPAHLVARA